MRRYAQQARDPIALSHGESLADAWFEDPSAVDPSLLSTALRVAAIRGDQARFDAYRKRFEETRVPSERSALLGAMAGFQDPGIVDQALAYALSGPLRPQEVGVAPLGLMDTEARRDRAFRWMTENYNAITQRIPVMFYPYLTRFAGGCSEQRLDAARAFFSDPERQVPGVQLELDKTASQVMDCVSLRDREGPAVTQYLQGQLGSR